MSEEPIRDNPGGVQILREKLGAASTLPPRGRGGLDVGYTAKVSMATTFGFTSSTSGLILCPMCAHWPTDPSFQAQQQQAGAGFVPRDFFGGARSRLTLDKRVASRYPD
jgi:hypothetical protein